MLTTNIAVNNIAPVELAASNPNRRELIINNPGPVAMQLFVGASLVSLGTLYRYGTVVFVTALGDPTDAILGLLVSAGPQNIAVSK